MISNIKVIKRNGKLVKYDFSKIENVLWRTYNSISKSVPDKLIEHINDRLDNMISKRKSGENISVEEIQDVIQKEMIRSNQFDAVESFIKYRYSQKRLRDYTSEKEKFIENYKNSSNTANATVDDNSNVSSKNISVLNAEIHKEDNIQINRRMMEDKLKELFPKYDYHWYCVDLAHHTYYKNDESSFAGSISPYCVAESLYPFLIGGIKDIGGLSAAPKNIDSFCGMYVNEIFATSAMFAGAVATPEFLVYFDYFARKAYGDDYRNHLGDFIVLGKDLRELLNKSGKWIKGLEELKNIDFEDDELNSLRDQILYNSERPLTSDELKDIEEHIANGEINYKIYIGDGTRTIKSQIHQFFQQIIYSINQPSAARGSQSAFINFSYFDEPFFNAMFDNFYFPDNTQPIWESVKWLQKDFMMWFNEERLKCILTFPVESVAMIYKDGEFVDKDMAEFVAQEYARGHSFFTYISDTADSLSSCCRLKNKVQTHEFNFTNGNMGVQTGSKSVITLNLSRITQDWYEEEFNDKRMSPTELPYSELKKHKKSYAKNLCKVLERVYKAQIAYNERLWEMYDAGLLPVYSAGFIHLDKQYLTVGLNGLNQAAEFLGLKCNKNDDYKDFCQFLFGTIKESNTKHNGEYFGHKVTFNTELIPAESLGAKNALWDRTDGYWVPNNINLYTSYVYEPYDEEISLLDKISLHGKDYVGDFLDGGSAAHLNLSEHLSVEQYRYILKYCAEQGCQYFTFNIPNSECQDCGYITKHPITKCPKCGSNHIDIYDRIIGYLTKIKSWSEARQIEQKHRVYQSKDEIL